MIKILLGLFAISYFSFVFILRTILIWKQTKKFPITYGSSDTAHDYIGRIVKILILLSALSVFFYIFLDRFYNYLLPIHQLENDNLQIVGLILAFSSMIWTITAQSQMKDSWRIGIDDKTKTQIIKEGLFKHFRHPIYMGVSLSAFSLFIIMPNVLFLVISLLTYIALAIQVRLEEEYLIKIHGEEYLHYLKKTTRWFF